MSLDLAALRAAVATHGRVVRVLVADTKGSVPREAGASMLVWAGGQSGTIGGGALEWDAATATTDGLRRIPLGPDLGQCCGGAVTLATEVFDTEALARLDARVTDGHALRPIGPAPETLAVTRLAARLRRGATLDRPLLVDGWLAEPVTTPTQSLWIYGAGHVGRALTDVIAPLPGWQITWLDTAPERFPATTVATRAHPAPQTQVADAPSGAHHLILTYSHALDLELCHRLLAHGFASCGLIGSKTKWARFRSRLAALGHAPAAIDRIVCPIGDPSLGKHPQAIALGVASALLRDRAIASAELDRPA